MGVRDGLALDVLAQDVVAQTFCRKTLWCHLYLIEGKYKFNICLVPERPASDGSKEDEGKGASQ
jgi:hypothetical protein